MKNKTKKHHQQQHRRNGKSIIRVVAKILTPSFEPVLSKLIVNYHFK